MDAALCRGMDRDVFYPSLKLTSTNRAIAVAAARAVCLECPVRTECFGAAIDRKETDGFSGGVYWSDPHERRRMLRGTPLRGAVSGSSLRGVR